MRTGRQNLARRVAWVDPESLVVAAVAEVSRNTVEAGGEGTRLEEARGKGRELQAPTPLNDGRAPRSEQEGAIGRVVDPDLQRESLLVSTLTRLSSGQREGERRADLVAAEDDDTALTVLDEGAAFTPVFRQQDDGVLQPGQVDSRVR